MLRSNESLFVEWFRFIDQDSADYSVEASIFSKTDALEEWYIVGVAKLSEDFENGPGLIIFARVMTAF